MCNFFFFFLCVCVCVCVHVEVRRLYIKSDNGRNVGFVSENDKNVEKGLIC